MRNFRRASKLERYEVPTDPKTSEELYGELARCMFNESGRDDAKKPDPDSCACVLLNPILEFLLTSKFLKTMYIISVLYMCICIAVLGNVNGLLQTILWVLAGSSAVFIFLAAFESLLVAHLKTRRAKFTFSLLYNWRWLGIACHPGIGHFLGSNDHSVIHCRLKTENQRWLTLKSFRDICCCYENAGYPAPRLLQLPMDWRSFEAVLAELRQAIGQLPVEIKKRVIEKTESDERSRILAEYSNDPWLLSYESDFRRAIKNARFSFRLSLDSIRGDKAVSALPSSFRVAHPSWQWRIQFDRGKISVDQLTAEYVKGTAWVIYFPDGFTGYYSKSRALSPRAALRYLGMRDPDRFNKDLQGWTDEKPLAVGGWHPSVSAVIDALSAPGWTEEKEIWAGRYWSGMVDLIDVMSRSLEFSLQSAVAVARHTERKSFMEARQDSLDPAPIEKYYAVRKRFEEELAKETEEALAQIQEFRSSASAWRCFPAM